MTRTRKNLGLGAAMAGGNPAYGRVENDFYPTPPEVTESLCRAYADVLRPMSVWEPCAGDGTMGDVLGRYAREVRMTDIAPRRADVGRGDFLAQTELREVTAIVTNPPFNLAEDIIRHALTGLDRTPEFFALVLKATFWHARRRQGLFSETRPYAVHPLTWRPDFHGLGGPTMDIIWTVWRPRHMENGARTTTYEPLQRPEMDDE